MPIRTPHGRSAAYRGLWQWPLRSPGRLAVTVVAVVVIAAGVSFGIDATSSRSGRGAAAPATPTAGVTVPIPSTAGPAASPEPTLLPPVPALTPTTLPISAAPAAALDVASRWTRAWVRPPDGTTAQQWLDGLRPLTTDEYLGVLNSVDPANIPATRVTGSAWAVEVSPQSVRVEVPTDAFKLVVIVVDDGPAGWRVADYDQA